MTAIIWRGRPIQRHSLLVPISCLIQVPQVKTGQAEGVALIETRRSHTSLHSYYWVPLRAVQSNRW